MGVLSIGLKHVDIQESGFFAGPTYFFSLVQCMCVSVSEKEFFPRTTVHNYNCYQREHFKAQETKENRNIDLTKRTAVGTIIEGYVYASINTCLHTA